MIDAQDAFDGRDPVRELMAKWADDIDFRVFSREAFTDTEKCRMCGRVGIYMDADTGHICQRWSFKTRLFRRCFGDDWMYESYCDTCAVNLIPTAIAMRDIYELRKYVNRLERAINEARTGKGHQDNGATSPTTGERHQRRHEWRSSGRGRHGGPQACEEHQRVSLL